MNALLPRTTQDRMTFLWEPFATSTPLKIVPNNARIGDLLHKQLLTGSNNLTRKPLKRLSTLSIIQSKLADSQQSIPKKAKKKKSLYLDASSSSSDEDSGEIRRPIIKLSSKKTRSLLNAKNLESEETELVNKTGVSACQKADNTKEVKNAKNNGKNTVPTVTDCGGRNVRGKNKGKIGSANADTDFKNTGVSSDEECKIFDESNTNKNIVNSKRHGLQTEENIVSDENVTKNKKLDDGNEAEKTKMCETHPKTTNKDDNKIQAQKRLPKATSNNNKLSKLHKRKGLNTVHKARGPKKLSVKDKLPGETANVENPITPLKLWAHKSNLSHQLFSDSREQEFIDSLDLTSGDINVSVEKTTCCSSNQGKPTPSKQIIPTNQDKDVCKNNKAKQERPARRKQKPKEYWMPENTSPTASIRGTVNSQTQSKRNMKTSNSKLQTVAKQKEEDVLIEEIKENQKSKKVIENVGPKEMKRTKRRKENILKEKISNAPDDEEAVITSTKEDELQKQKMKQSGLSADVKPDEVVGEKAVTTDKTVFQLFSELSFKENEMGCSVVQCHNISSFKCGVLKLKVKSELKCKTLHRNSHLGGVVVKGLIRMKVGEKESELKQGDMAFVPPLTEWQATNINDSESVFYYWCGRLK